MKKSFVLIALIAVSFCANSQSMKVQSAYSDMKNERLAKAKENIDEACQNEKTINEPKTWNYAGLIYAQIVDASNNNEKLFKKQKISTPVDELCKRGLECFRKSLELEKKEGTHEFTQSTMEAMKVLCGYEFMYAGKVYNDGDYQKGADMFNDVIDNAKICGHKDVMLDAMYYQADCYRMLKQKDKEYTIYRELAKNNTSKYDVYLKVYLDNRQQGDTTKAINALKKGVKATAKDNAGNTILRSQLASAYLWAKQDAEADKILNDMLANGSDNPATLNAVANIYVDQNKSEQAIELFTKSLSINNSQIDAHRGLGLVYFNKAADGYKQAEAIPMDQQEAYDKKIKESNDIFAQAIPYFNDALKINPKDFMSLKALKNIYSKLASRQDIDAATRDNYKKLYQEVSVQLEELTK